jgi:hypothetical protein
LSTDEQITSRFASNTQLLTIDGIISSDRPKRWQYSQKYTSVDPRDWLCEYAISLLVGKYF